GTAALPPDEPRQRAFAARGQRRHRRAAAVRARAHRAGGHRAGLSRGRALMQAFIVGGAVRDELLGLLVRDRDWVVVGATPEDMLAAGFRPVGKDFPVFLHPDTHEEYALARTERKTGR